MGMIFVSRNQKNLGQFTEQEISNALNSGEILPTDLAWQDGMETWQPVSTLSSLPAPASIESESPAHYNNLTSRCQKPGQICLKECFRKAWEAFVKNWGVCVGTTLIFLGILFSIRMVVLSWILSMPFEFGDPDALLYRGKLSIGVSSSVIGISHSMILSIFSAGFSYFFINTLRTKAKIGLLFVGFRHLHWIQILLASGVSSLAAFVLVMIILGAIVYVGFGPYISIVIFGLCVLVPMIYLSMGMSFVFPLIVDRNMRFWAAITTAFRTIHSQWARVFQLIVLTWLLAVAGLLLCGVGIFFTIPFSALVLSQGYRQLFGDPDCAKVE